jgi:hypothetical protein
LEKELEEWSALGVEPSEKDEDEEERDKEVYTNPKTKQFFQEWKEDYERILQEIKDLANPFTDFKYHLKFDYCKTQAIEHKLTKIEGIEKRIEYANSLK